MVCLLPDCREPKIALEPPDVWVTTRLSSPDRVTARLTSNRAVGEAPLSATLVTASPTGGAVVYVTPSVQPPPVFETRSVLGLLVFSRVRTRVARRS
jgi:hypothetical protein